jgi:hypothetical protein
VCGCTSSWMPARWAARWQAYQATLVSIGISPVGGSLETARRFACASIRASVHATQHHIPVFASLARAERPICHEYS